VASVVLECPHCGVEKVGFSFSGEVQSPTGPPNTKRFRTVLICSSCEEIVVAIFDGSPSATYSPSACPGDPRKFGWNIFKSYPQPALSKCPTHTPGELKRIFDQAANALKRRDPDASGAMSRKVVDVSTQQLLGEQSKKYSNIQGRIDALAAANKLTPDLKDWAHQVRLGGNDAAHDLDPFTQEEADELLDFADLYLTYVYSLPARLKERRERSEKEKAVAGKSS
jgi:hypothetical protein